MSRRSACLHSRRRRTGGCRRRDEGIRQADRRDQGNADHLPWPTAYPHLAFAYGQHPPEGRKRTGRPRNRRRHQVGLRGLPTDDAKRSGQRVRLGVREELAREVGGNSGFWLWTEGCK
jgi:hypothetical protein